MIGEEVVLTDMLMCRERRAHIPQLRLKRIIHSTDFLIWMLSIPME